MDYKELAARYKMALEAIICADDYSVRIIAKEALKEPSNPDINSSAEGALQRKYDQYVKMYNRGYLYNSAQYTKAIMTYEQWLAM